MARTTPNTTHSTAITPTDQTVADPLSDASRYAGPARCGQPACRARRVDPSDAPAPPTRPGPSAPLLQTHGPTTSRHPPLTPTVSSAKATASSLSSRVSASGPGALAVTVTRTRSPSRRTVDPRAPRCRTARRRQDRVGRVLPGRRAGARPRRVHALDLRGRGQQRPDQRHRERAPARAAPRPPRRSRIPGPGGGCRPLLGPSPPAHPPAQPAPSALHIWTLSARSTIPCSSALTCPLVSTL